MRTATIVIPHEATVEKRDGFPNSYPQMRNELNGKILEIVNEDEYTGECGVDWEKYDYVVELSGGDVYSFHKSWLKNIKDDAPIKEQKIWSVWVDGFEMNSYILDYAGALKMKEELEMEGECDDSEIIIDDTYNPANSNAKKLLENTLVRYRSRIAELEKEEKRLESEWEAWPSGEMNESQVPIDMTRIEIDTLEEVVGDLESLLEHGFFGDN